MRILATLAAIVGLTVLGLFATGNLSVGGAARVAADTTSAPVPTAAPDGTSLQPAPEGHSIAACIDSTASTDAAFAESILASTTQAVQNYVPAMPTVTKDGVLAVPGLDLTIRLVSTRPLAFGQSYLNVQIPSVNGLAARPDMTALGALDPGGSYLMWKKSEEQWATDYQTAIDAEATAVKQLGTVDLTRPGRSGVRDCVAALNSVASKYSNVTLIVASDLGDNSFTGANPTFAGKPMVLIQPCPDGDAKRCAGLQEKFTSWAVDHGSGSITVTRPENSLTTLSQLITRNNP